VPAKPFGMAPAWPAMFQQRRAPAATNRTVGLMAAVKPETIVALTPMTPATYRVMLQKMIAYKRWKMAFFYIYSTRYAAAAASMPAELSAEAAPLKEWLTKSSVFFDLLANYEITGFIYCILLVTWSLPAPTDMKTFVGYAQSIKTVQAFFTWQYFLIFKDYMTLFPDAYTWVDPKVKAFVLTAETYSCFYAFNEWHVSKMMGLMALKDSELTSDISKAKLASFFWDMTFIKTVKTLAGLTMASWSYPKYTWLKSSKPFIALSLPFIAFIESYWEFKVADLNEAKVKADPSYQALPHKAGLNGGGK